MITIGDGFIIIGMPLERKINVNLCIEIVLYS